MPQGEPRGGGHTPAGRGSRGAGARETVTGRGVLARPTGAARARPVGSVDRPRSELRLLRGFELWSERRPVPIPLAGQRLLAYLALEGAPQNRARVAGTLWPNVPEPRATANLRSTLWRLRRVGRSLVRADTARVQLAPDVDVDVHRVVALARHLHDRPLPPKLLPNASLLLEGDLLPDWYDEWVLPERERFRQIRLHALERLADLFAEAGRYAEAIDAGMRAAASDPLRESPRRTIIRMHLIEGNRAEAIRQFEAYQGLLRLELGVDPSPAMLSLVADIVTA